MAERVTKRICTLGDTGEAGGVFLESGQEGEYKVTANSLDVCVNGALFVCSAHGPTTLNAYPSDTFVESKNVGMEEYSTFACGDKVVCSEERNVFVGIIPA